MGSATWNRTTPGGAPEDQWLWPSSFDPENRVMRYRGNPTVCNTCPVKDACTVSAKGREVTRQLDPWPHSETGRFHRGVSLAVALMGFILPIMSLLVHSDTADLILTGSVLIILIGGTMPLARHLWTTPSNFPEALPSMDNIEAEVTAAVTDKYGVKYRSTKKRSPVYATMKSPVWRRNMGPNASALLGRTTRKLSLRNISTTTVLISGQLANPQIKSKAQANLQ